ncbi:sensor histidine kinase [Microseira wollei]|uniref:histidine kinase n=1 Tax=Microseira wollei NIES-4236 TaxID=2530354 RepID=A0AAV3X7P8_9CYAN|nr:HAMP domain-containing sensor histidine kinase [Microseira wollei]GET37835.1 histidine Kinase [Microseira wollei NIES-4236]
MRSLKAFVSRRVPGLNYIFQGEVSEVMSVQKWLLPTVSEIIAQSESLGADDAAFCAKSTDGKEAFLNASMALERVKAEQQWQSGIASLEHLLQEVVTVNDPALGGLVLTCPSPIISDPALNSRCQTWIFTPQMLEVVLAGMLFQLPPAKDEHILIPPNSSHSLPLLPIDPIAAEQFCLVLTNKFSLVMVLGENLANQPAFLFSFDPEVVQQAWECLKLRMLLMHQPQFRQLDALVEQFGFAAPDYRTVMKFSRLMLKYLPMQEETRYAKVSDRITKAVDPMSDAPSAISKSDDVELLQAFAHEVRTPLTTIRMLTRLLLKRKELSPDVIKRLEYIDHECTEQIDRMELLFQAAEIETTDAKSSNLHLTTTDLTQLLQDSLPRWQKQASRRNLTIEVRMPQQMPPVESDPTMLDRILTGLIENFTRNLPAASHIELQAIPAGNQIKVQLKHFIEPESGKQDGMRSQPCNSNKRKQIGQLLMFQPETGSICLNHSVTKNIFQALGGKLIVKQRPQQGEVLTIFLPIVKGKK